MPSCGPGQAPHCRGARQQRDTFEAHHAYRHVCILLAHLRVGPDRLDGRPALLLQLHAPVRLRAPTLELYDEGLLLLARHRVLVERADDLRVLLRGVLRGVLPRRLLGQDIVDLDEDLGEP